MEASVPLLLAAVIGFTHAFEVDHLVAVGNIVTKRNKLLLAFTDGSYWRFGLTFTIFLVGLLIIVGRPLSQMVIFLTSRQLQASR